MARVQRRVDDESKTTVYTVNGEFPFEQIADVIRHYYLAELTLNVVFDLSEADVSAITTGQMEQIIDLGKQFAHLRSGGKTAFIATSHLGYGLSRMYESYSELKDHPILHGSFRDIDDAMDWIREPDSEG